MLRWPISFKRFIIVMLTFYLVNDISFENISNEEAVRILKEVAHKPGPIKLVVGTFCNLPHYSATAHVTVHVTTYPNPESDPNPNPSPE